MDYINNSVHKCCIDFHSEDLADACGLGIALLCGYLCIDLWLDTILDITLDRSSLTS